MTSKNGKLKFVFISVPNLDVAILLDRAQLIRQFQKQSNLLYGIPTAEFYTTNSIPDPIILGVENASSEHPILKLFYPNFGPLLNTSNNIDSLVSVECLEANKSNPISLDIDFLFFKRLYKDNILMLSHSQKSTRGKSYLMAVASVYQHLLCASLINALSDLTKRGEFRYDNIKKDVNRIHVLTEAFSLNVFNIKRRSLIENLEQYSIFTEKIPREYPSLKKIMSDYRCGILKQLINNALTIAKASRYRVISIRPQYITSQEMISDRAKVTTTQVRHLMQLFHDLGLIEIIDKEYYNNSILRSRVKYKLPIVISIPWLDEMLLKKVENRAKKFLAENKTIMSLGSIDTETNEKYLGLKTCVISLLDQKPYIIKDDLVEAIELNGICEEGKSGKYIYERYFPEVAKDLNLYKANFNKILQEHLNNLGYHPKLTYGVSTIYFREDLFNVRNNQINS